MQTLQNTMGSTLTYRLNWETPQIARETDSEHSVVHLATSVTLRDQLTLSFREPTTIFNLVSDLRDVAHREPLRATCGVIDLDLFGLELDTLRWVLAGEQKVPIILIGTCFDARLPVRALKAGAHDFFPKPLDVNALVAAVASALEHDRRLAAKWVEERELRTRMSLLTPREKEVLPLVVGGLLNKQAASLLGISEITLQIHRGQVMRKMQARSLPDLVRMCIKLRVPHWRPTA